MYEINPIKKVLKLVLVESFTLLVFLTIFTASYSQNARPPGYRTTIKNRSMSTMGSMNSMSHQMSMGSERQLSTRNSMRPQMSFVSSCSPSDYSRSSSQTDALEMKKIKPVVPQPGVDWEGPILVIFVSLIRLCSRFWIYWIKKSVLATLFSDLILTILDQLGSSNYSCYPDLQAGIFFNIKSKTKNFQSNC